MKKFAYKEFSTESDVCDQLETWSKNGWNLNVMFVKITRIMDKIVIFYDSILDRGTFDPAL